MLKIGNDTVYNGTWSVDKYHGEGVLHCPDGVSYAGQVCGCRSAGERMCGVPRGCGGHVWGTRGEWDGAPFNTLLLTNRVGCPPPPPWTAPPPLKILARIFFRAFGRLEIFSGAFGLSLFRPEVLFGTSKNSAPPGGGGGGWSHPPTPSPLEGALNTPPHSGGEGAMACVCVSECVFFSAPSLMTS